MAKNHRVELRLSDHDYQLLNERANYYGTTLTQAVETLLHTAVPVRVCGVYSVGEMGRRRLNITFSNGMTVHGFLWSRGGQLLGPSVIADQGRVRIVNGTREFWRALREFCTRHVGLEDEPADPNADLNLALIQDL
jgi:hypothetical protein